MHCSERAPEDKDGDCSRLRDWLWWKCRKFFRSRSVKFTGSFADLVWRQLKDEIMTPTYKIMNGKIKVEDKDELKKRGVRSPNLADALNLTFYGDHELFDVHYNTLKNSALTPLDRYRKVWKKREEGSWKSR